MVAEHGAGSITGGRLPAVEGLIAVGVFVAAVGVMAYLQRGGWQRLDALPPLPGERLLVEVGDVWVVARHPTPDRGATLPGGVARVTTERLVVAQRPLFNRGAPSCVTWSSSLTRTKRCPPPAPRW